MSFVVVLPVAPVMPTTRAVERSRTAPPIAASAAVRVVGDERRRRAAGERVRDEVLAAADRDEEIALLDPRESRSCTPVTSSAQGRANSRPSGSSTAELERDHARPPTQRSRTTSRSSNGTFPVASSCSGSAPRPAITTTSPGCASPSASSIAARRSSSSSSTPSSARRDLGGDRCGILGAGVVGGEDRRGRRARQRPAPSRAASCGRDRRPRRRRPSGCPRRVRAPREARCSSESGVCA